MANNFVFRMSSAGKCPKALWAQRTGVEGEPVPAWLADAAEEGTVQEAIVKDKLRKEGWLIEEGGKCTKCTGHGTKGIHVDMTYGNMFIVGHMDGTATKDNEKRILEVKTMSQFEFDRWMKGGFDAFPAYAAQLSCYMEAYGLTKALYAVKNRNNGYLHKTLIDKQPVDFKSVMQQIGRSTAKEMPDVEPDFETFACRRCAYKKLCIRTKEDMVVQNEAALNDACEIWREGNAEMESGEAKVKQAKAVFLEQAIATHLKKYTYNNLAVSMVERNYTGYDKKLLEELFTVKQLKPALVVKPIAPYVTVTDLNKEA